MKLLVKTSIYYVTASLLSLIIAGFLIYVNYKNILNKDVDKFLINREEIATTQIINDAPISSLNNYEQIIKKTQSNDKLDQLIFENIDRYDIIDDQFHSYRKLEVTRKIGENYYEITIFKSLIQSNVLINEVLISVVEVFIGILLFLIIWTLIISRKLWKPFKMTLLLLENYELGSSKSINFSKTSTLEFNQLNTMLNRLIEKIRYDYLNLKEFTANAAHEIQTPLAIIRNKCELLLQSKDLNQDQLIKLQSIYNSCLRLSKINRGLSLMAKIEAKSFEIQKNVNVTKILINLMDYFKEIIDLNKVTLSSDINHQISFDINAELAEILISNLFRNAIKHNKELGEIHVKTTESSIVFSNTGENKPIDKQLFQRFKKTNSNSLGIGLSIITKICEIHNVKLYYKFLNNRHVFRIDFKTESLQN